MKTFRLTYNKLGGKIFLNYMILILLLLFFLEITSYEIIQTSFKNINENFAQAELKLKNEKLDDFIKELDDLSKTIISDREMIDLLNKENAADTNLESVPHNLQYALSNNVDAIFLISNTGKIYRESDNELMDYVSNNLNQFMDQAADTHGEMLFSNSHFINYATEKHGDNLFFAVRKIRSIDTFDTIGTMIIAIRESVLWDTIDIDSELGDFYITDTDGKIVSSKNKSYVGTNISDILGQSLPDRQRIKFTNSFSAKNLAINSQYNKSTGWVLLNMADTDKINKDFYAVQRVIILIGVIAIIIAIYFSGLISNNVTRPLNDLISSMQRVAKGDLAVQTDVSLTKNSSAEVKELNDMFNHMTLELRTLIQRVREESIKEKDAELRALKAQINPHFLYNALDTVYWMLINKNDYEIADIVTRIGQILRYGIKKNSTEVPIQEEIQQIKNYLFLQKARFEENLEYQIDVDRNLLDCKMLSFIIQPFVENAINHGLMHSKGKGMVTIRAFQDNDVFVFEISDNGEGMTPEEVENLYHPKAETKGKHTGLGVNNVCERIKFFYGEPYGVAINSKKEEGTKVIIRIPKSGLSNSIAKN